MPAVIIILLSFILILVLMRYRVPLYLGVFASIIFLAFFIQRGFPVIGQQFLVTGKSGEVISLLVIILLILLFSTALRLGGRLDRMTETFSGLVHNRRTQLATFPALIGLLPMPGGAWFSAPMVKAIARGIPEHVGLLTAINYWFRHIWEYWWPLYPGVLLATSLSGLSLPHVIAVMLPMTAVVVVIGVLTIFRDVSVNRSENPGTSEPRKRSSWAMFFAAVWPILAVVIGGVALELAREVYVASGHSFYQPLPRTIIIAALAIVSVATIVSDRVDMRRLLAEYADRKQLELVAMIFAVLYYKNVLDAGGLVVRSVGELQAWHIPVWLVIVILPALIGVVTGVVVAAIGVSFPVVLGVAAGANLPLVPVLVVAYTAAMVGVMFSPIHFCLLLSLQYFGDTFGPVYKRITVPLLAVFACAVALAWLYSIM